LNLIRKVLNGLGKAKAHSLLKKVLLEKNRNFGSLILEEKIICWNCNAEIIQYDHDGYKGTIGRYPICGVDFPLE